MFFCMFVCRKCSAAGCSSCATITYCAHLRAAQHPRLGALGDIAMSVLLHRYGDRRYNILILDTLLHSVIAELVFCKTADFYVVD